jgi:AraC-like DNA-binding protein
VPAQTFRERTPVAALDDYVTCVWVQLVAGHGPTYTHRTVPNGSAELVCELGAAARIVGPQTRPTAETIQPGTSVVGIRFRPGAAPALLGVPASELVDRVIEAESLWGSAASALGERVAAATSPEEAAAALERAMVACVAGGPRLDAVVVGAVRRLESGANRIEALASTFDVSQRSLRRRCLAAVGVTPKSLQRMVRFQRFLALSKLSHRPTANLAVLALRAGYADQAHLSRESLRLGGRSPRVLLRDSESHCGGAHDHAASYGALLRRSDRFVLATAH